MNSIGRRGFVVGTAAALASAGTRSQDSAYPNKPIRWIVSYPAGGGADWFTRTVAERVSANLKQPIVIDNRPGAAGTIGLAALAQAQPDGYTVITGDSGTVTMSPLIFKTLPYDPIKAFTPVSIMARGPLVWTVNPGKVAATSFKEFVELARQRPGAISYASFGEGSLTHLMTELLCARAGIKLLHIPYKGAAPAQQDLLSGVVDTMFAPVGMAKAMESSGRSRALASSSRGKIQLMPDLVAIKDQGVEYDVGTWQGALVPAGTPVPIVERLRTAINAALADPTVVRLLTEQAYVVAQTSTAEFEQEIRREMGTWKPVVEASNIRIQ
jgi:tripartite-type tricarboxylate transporter receptor subunit TctC